MYQVNNDWAQSGKVANVWGVDYIRMEELSGKVNVSCRPITSHRREDPLLPPGHLVSGKIASCKFSF